MHILTLDEGDRCFTDVIVGSLNGIILLLCSCHICWIYGLERVLEQRVECGLAKRVCSLCEVRAREGFLLPQGRKAVLAEKARPNPVTFLALLSLARS